MRLSRFTPALLLALAACAAPAPLPDAQVLIFGEQHDQPDHQRQTAQAVRRLADAVQIAALSPGLALTSADFTLI